MKAAMRGFRKPTLAKMMPSASTAMVPTNFCQIILRLRRATDLTAGLVPSEVRVRG